MKVIKCEVNTYTKSDLEGMKVTASGSVKTFISFIGMTLKNGVSHELDFFHGVGSDEDTKSFQELESKLFDLKDDLDNVYIFHDNFTKGEGIRSYGGYFDIASPDEAITVKSISGANTFRQGSWMKYNDKYEIFFLQYTKNTHSGVLGIIHNLGMDPVEFDSFTKKLSEQTSTENQIFEKSVPTDKFTYVEWNHPDHDKSLKEAAERAEKREKEKEEKAKAEAEKRKAKAKKDIELLK